MAILKEKNWKVYKLRQYNRRKARPYYVIALVVAICLGSISLVVNYALYEGEASLSSHHISKRSTSKNDSVLTTDSTTLPDIGNYPKDLFTLKQWRQGAVVLHTAGMIYMFIALAIVCDEFFVPALEVITEKLDLTEDVAGATFMAAGGSAPELFTSVAGLFLSENSVGISTIIGSAVFNILFVIGACALAARELLHLTWWPLFRDSIFYSISLVVLIISYLDWKIYYYEAIALLLCYALYVIFMIFNGKIEKKVKGAICRTSATRISNVDLVPVSSNVSLMFVKNGGERLNVTLYDQSKSRPASSMRFRAGLLQLMIHTIDPLATGNIEDQATRLRTLATQKKESIETNTTPVDQNGNRPDDGAGQPNGGSRVHSAIGSSNSNRSSLTAVESVEGDAAANNHSPAKSAKMETIAATNGFDVTVRTTTNSPEGGLSRGSAAGGDGEEEDDENAPLDISWPKTHRKRFSYIMLAPIIFPLYFTLPDTRKPERRKFYPLTFIGSILWIAFFAVMMVWWASVLCVAIGIPVEIIGLTVLAAGTSVPDLLTSVIVARKGFGDMAISSSIGSNIFDITVGLPLPWFIGCLINIPAPFVNVDAAGLLCSIILLFCMLLVVIGTIAIFKWRLNKPLGITYIILYLTFVTMSVLLAINLIPCIEINFAS